MSPELPSFTLLTGINGSGKSHLLEGIKAGAITSNVAPRPDLDIGYFDWNSLVPNDTGPSTLSTIHEHRDWIVRTIRERKDYLFDSLLDALAEQGIDIHYASDPWEALDATKEELIAKGLSERAAVDALSAIQTSARNLYNHVVSPIGSDIAKQRLIREMGGESAKLHRLTSSDFDIRPFSASGNNLFQQSFGHLFFAYFDKQRANLLGQAAVTKGQQPLIPPLSDADFIQKHGRPPWELVNEILERARLDFRIDHPEAYQSTEYLPRLTKLSSGSEIQFSSLSSGEKVLMSLAFSLYNASDHRQEVPRPKLLLLDEIDAPLHPSMSRSLIDIIAGVLVNVESIPVIMVTHSPSTVAVSPEDSIHLVQSNPTRISRESKRRAVATLTADIPTLSIDFSGRRQVFVESDLDADRYQLLFQIMSRFIGSELSLVFIGVGNNNMGTGCAQVYKLVGDLVLAGNSSTLGLVDWDRKNNPTGRVLIIGGGKRYSIENYLLDPLLVVAALINQAPTIVEKLELSPDVTFSNISGVAAVELQKACRVVENRVLESINGVGKRKPMDLIETEYLAGITLEADREYALVNGHDLEEHLKKVFPSELKPFHNTGQLLRHMVDVVIRNHPSFAPRDLVNTLKMLCEAEL